MLQDLRHFFKRHWQEGSPLLLGFSGGPDSKALLYGLLELGYREIQLAHIDHGWREESKEEAFLLSQEAKQLKLPFHTIRLTLPTRGNLEEAARIERLKFFQSLHRQFSFQALLLAHHADDLAETVLKRVLEGAHLANLLSMQPVSAFNDLPIWRPFLGIEKTQILSFLKKRKLSFFEDSTNLDLKYLRSRMRQEILPRLRESFGKGISHNLVLLSQRSLEHREYLDAKIAHLLPLAGPWGEFYSCEGLMRPEVRHLLQMKATQKKIHWPRAALEKALDAIILNKANHWALPSVFIDRGLVFFLKSSFPRFGATPLPIVPGIHRSGDWTISIEKTSGSLPPSDWQAVWTGHFAAISSGSFLSLPSQKCPFRSLWNERKVPAFLRDQIPLCWNGSEPFQEFLAGHKRSSSLKSAFQLTFSIT